MTLHSLYKITLVLFPSDRQAKLPCRKLYTIHLDLKKQRIDCSDHVIISLHVSVGQEHKFFCAQKILKFLVTLALYLHNPTFLPFEINNKKDIAIVFAIYFMLLTFPKALESPTLSVMPLWHISRYCLLLFLDRIFQVWQIVLGAYVTVTTANGLISGHTGYMIGKTLKSCFCKIEKLRDFVNLYNV